jgi:hypothetical protein
MEDATAETQSEPEGELIVAGSDTAEVLETAEGVLDQVAAAVSVFIISDRAFAVSPSGNYGTALASRR